MNLLYNLFLILDLNIIILDLNTNIKIAKFMLILFILFWIILKIIKIHEDANFYPDSFTNYQYNKRILNYGLKKKNKRNRYF